MKRYLAFFLMLSMGCAARATAGSDSCTHTSIYDSIAWVDYVGYSSAQHEVLSEIDTYCDVCGTILDIRHTSTYQAHGFKDGVCMNCGYVRTGMPSAEELQRQALERAISTPDDITGKAAVVIHSGQLHALPIQWSRSMGQAEPGDTYRILSYQIADSQTVWLEVPNGTSRAWISAGLVVIDDQTAPEDSGMNLYIGRACTIKVGSGRARATPGTDAIVTAYVSKGQTYRILDSQNAPDGTLWLQINVAGNDCWISSGIANIH